MTVVVRVHDDINVKVLSEGPLMGKFIYWPNSTRRDLPMMFTIPSNAPVPSSVPWTSKTAPETL